MNYTKKFLMGISMFSLINLSSHSQEIPYVPPRESTDAVKKIKFNSAIPIDDNYKMQFHLCDKLNMFYGVKMSGFRKCTPDKNQLKALLKFPDNTIFFESKLSLDIDGSWKACNSRGPTDQCPTWYRWKNLPLAKSYVDPDKYPYIVIPIAGLEGRADYKFRTKTRIDKGDIGVVIYKDKVVPVFVADGGPHNKIGEGSSALFKALGEDRCSNWGSDGHCDKYKDFSIPNQVLFFIFPDSNIDNLSPDNALEYIQAEALNRFRKLLAP